MACKEGKKQKSWYSSKWDETSEYISSYHIHEAYFLSFFFLLLSLFTFLSHCHIIFMKHTFLHFFFLLSLFTSFSHWRLCNHSMNLTPVDVCIRGSNIKQHSTLQSRLYFQNILPVPVFRLRKKSQKNNNKEN